MKTFQCHKRVMAAKITGIRRDANGWVHMRLEGQAGEICSAGAPQFDKAKIGGYFVQYDDGYHSYSPAKAFEGGYAEVLQS